MENTMTLPDFGNIASIGSFLLALIGVFKLWPALRKWKLRREASNFYVAKRMEAGADIYRRIWDFQPGSREFELAEHLVERGMMFRREMGTYGLWAPPETNDPST